MSALETAASILHNLVVGRPKDLDSLIDDIGSPKLLLSRHGGDGVPVQYRCSLTGESSEIALPLPAHVGLALLKTVEDGRLWLDCLSKLGLYDSGSFDPLFLELLLSCVKEGTLKRFSAVCTGWNLEDVPLLSKGVLSYGHLAVALTEHATKHGFDEAEYMLCWASDEMIAGFPGELFPFERDFRYSPTQGGWLTSTKPRTWYPLEEIDSSEVGREYGHVLCSLKQHAVNPRLGQELLQMFGCESLSMGFGNPSGEQLCYAKASFLTSFELRTVDGKMMELARWRFDNYFPLAVMIALQEEQQLKLEAVPERTADWMFPKSFIDKIAGTPALSEPAQRTLGLDVLRVIGRHAIKESMGSTSPLDVYGVRYLRDSLGLDVTQMQMQVPRYLFTPPMSDNPELPAVRDIVLDCGYAQSGSDLEERKANFREIFNRMVGTPKIEGMLLPRDPALLLSAYFKCVKKSPAYQNIPLAMICWMEHLGADLMVEGASKRRHWELLFELFGDDAMREHMHRAPDATMTNRMLQTLDF